MELQDPNVLYPWHGYRDDPPADDAGHVRDAQRERSADWRGWRGVYFVILSSEPESDVEGDEEGV
jgi:hypothetical protein